MKKFISLVMVICLALAMFAGISVFAEDGEYKVVTPPAGATNLVKNGDFESGFDNYSVAIKEHSTIVTEEGRGNVARIERTAEWDADKSLGVNSALTTTITGLEPGAEYQLTVDLKISSLGEKARTIRRGPMFYLTFDDKTQANYPAITDTNGEWKKVGGSFVVPAGNTGAQVSLRFFGYGEIYWDNLEIVKIGGGVKAEISANHFYYTESKQGTVKLDFKEADFTGYKYDVSIKDGATEIFKDSVPAADYIDYKFDLGLLATIGKEYTLTVELKNASGDSEVSLTKDIYRYDRPTHLTADGRTIDGNGKEFYPVIGYHVYYEDIGAAVENGVNVLRSYNWKDGSSRATFYNIDGLKKWLDTAWYEYGAMTLVQCYGYNYNDGMGSAGSKSNIPLVQEMIKTVKDHPGLLGYLVQDEPYNHEPKIGAQAVTDELKAAYKAIREVDNEHVIVHVANKENHWDKSIDLSDVIISDRYPQGNMFHSLQFNFISKAKLMSEGKKPVWNLLEASPQTTSSDPNGTTLRNMVYQTLFAKGDGIGYISVSLQDEYAGETGKNGMLGRPDVLKATKSLKAGELADSVKAFITGEYPTFCELAGEPYTGSVGEMITKEVAEDYWYKAYKKDGQLYMLVLNHENAETPVEIKLTSTDGSESVGEFTATVADTFNEQHTVTGNNVFKTTLTPRAAVLYKIETGAATPNPELVGYEWAAGAINTVTAQGIANKFGDKFAPAETITRADFAGWLIRTLGLTAEATDNFADVAADEYYAKEIAIGKALGVLNGVGNGLYNPKAPISRQDLMVICTRGMKLVKELKLDTSALNVFSDNALIADYAKEGITGMVTEGIIKGNADGTINPLGNTTRAEAAVIMERILGWK